MNVIKQHLFEVVCGLVIVAALSTYFLWSSYDENTRLAAGIRNGQQTHVTNINKAVTPMPGLDASDPRNTLKGPIPGDSSDPRDKTKGSAVALKAQVFNDLQRSAQEIANSETRQNSANRMMNGSPALPVFDKGAMAWEAQPFLLPMTITQGRNKQDPHIYQQTYNEAYNGFLSVLGAGMPPLKEDVDAAFDKEQNINVPRGARSPLGGGQVARDPAKLRDFEKKFVMDWDSKIRIYADRTSFQIEPWVLSGQAPDESEIFHGFVYTWIQADLVNAIARVNLGSKTAQSSPIKRIETVSIGATAEAGTAIGTPAFVAPAAGAMAGGMPAPVPVGALGGSGPLFISMSTGGTPVLIDQTPGAVAPPTLDGYTKAMTGRAVSELFDVTHVRVVLHMEPGYLNQFLSELYKQSNSYTLINVNMQAIDPLEAAANGFIYGSAPTMRVELVFEAIFYRSWLEQFMPDDGIRTAIGLKALGTAGPGRQGGPGGGGPGGGGPGMGPGGGGPGGPGRQPAPGMSNGRQAAPGAGTPGGPR